MSETVGHSDVGIGLALAFGLVAVLAAVAMAVTVHDQVVAGWSFAVAMVAGSLAVAALHVFGETNR